VISYKVCEQNSGQGKEKDHIAHKMCTLIVPVLKYAEPAFEYVHVLPVLVLTPHAREACGSGGRLS
jgi:hypothetical protein